MKTILFQGDSITDVFRDWDNGEDLGKGYPLFVSSKLGYEMPGQFKFYNRGRSGDRIVDVYARIKADIINLKPDFMSILIGVNDVWQEYLEGNGVSAEKFEKIYCMIIEEVKQELPNCEIMIMAPFLLKGEATEEKWDEFFAEVKNRAKIAKKVAEKYGLKFVALQDKFDEAQKKMPQPYWAYDGVHPTHNGHALIQKAWLDGFNAR